MKNITFLLTVLLFLCFDVKAQEIFAGGGTVDNTPPTAVTLDPVGLGSSNNQVCIGDYLSQSIKCVDLVTNLIKTYANYGLNFPSNSVELNGVMYFVDYLNGTIKYVKDGTTKIFAGTGKISTSISEGTAADKTGFGYIGQISVIGDVMYVPDFNNYVLRYIDRGGIVRNVKNSIGALAPFGSTVANNELYVSDLHSSKIWKLNGDMLVEWLNFKSFGYLAAYDGQIYAADKTSIYKIDIATKTPTLFYTVPYNASSNIYADEIKGLTATKDFLYFALRTSRYIKRIRIKDTPPPPPAYIETPDSKSGIEGSPPYLAIVCCLLLSALDILFIISSISSSV